MTFNPEILILNTLNFEPQANSSDISFLKQMFVSGSSTPAYKASKVMEQEKLLENDFQIWYFEIESRKL